jgi:hypothetical protein
MRNPIHLFLSGGATDRLLQDRLKIRIRGNCLAAVLPDRRVGSQLRGEIDFHLNLLCLRNFPYPFFKRVPSAYKQFSC